MPQFDPSNFSPQLVWLAITFVILYFVMARIALPRIASVLEGRQSRISADLEKAEQLRAEAEQVLADYEKAMADSREKAQAMLRDAKEEMAAEAARRERELGEKLARNAESAEKRIEAARQEALDNIRDVAVEAAQAAAKRLLDMDVERGAAEAAVKEAAGGRR